MKDLRIELRAKNNALYTAIIETGLSIAAWAERVGVGYASVIGLINFKEQPRRRRSGRLTRLAQALCEATGIDAETLFPPALYQAITAPKAVFEVSSQALLTSLGAAAQLEAPDVDRADHTDQRLDIIRALETLTPREEKVIRWRFGLDDTGEQTLEEVGARLGVQKERARQIEAKALRKLRHPRLRKYLPRTTPRDVTAVF